MKYIFDYKTSQTNYFGDANKLEGFNISQKILVKNALKKATENSDLPQISEVDLVRHFTNLSKKVYGVDNGIYPLGSCTMKYNPKISEKIASYQEFNNLHPYTEIASMQGSLRITFELEKMLAEISGMDAVTLEPCAGAHGEFTGLLIIDKYHKSRGDFKRKKVILPDTAHGTNPATCAVLGFEVEEIKTDEFGNVNLDILRNSIDETTAAFMLTNPSTLGFFEENILEIAKIAHEKGALLYYDGANLNALLGLAKPGEMGFDVMHFNLHKTFATPHGAGGPGAGPVGVKDFLKEFLPNPRINFDGEKYFIELENAKSIGRVRSFFGNFQVLLKAYIYILILGSDGLKKSSEIAILNANYLLAKVKKIFEYPFGDKTCMHEFVVSAKNLKDVKAVDIAKRMLDFGVHPPTIYFPLIVAESMMFEPTETESKENLDELAKILEVVKTEIEMDGQKLKNAPIQTPIGRLDEVKAVKNPKLILEKNE